MAFEIERQGANVNVRVRVEGNLHSDEEIFSAVRACCSRSWWSCPSGECAKVATWQSKHERGVILLTLLPREGAELSDAGVAECLRYVLDDAGGPGPLAQ